MPHAPATRQRLIAEWRRAYASACSTVEAPGSQAAWMARLKLRLYRILLSLYGEGQWTESSSTGVSTDSAVAADLEAIALAGKPAKSLGEIQKALKSVSGACNATPKCGPLVAGDGSDAWIVVASSRGGIDADQCGDLLKRQAIVARIVHGESESTVAVRSLHEMATRRLVEQNRARLALPRTPTIKPRELPKVAPPIRGSVYRILGWILLAVPLFLISGYYNLITFHPEFAAFVPPEAVFASFVVLTGIALLPVFLRLMFALDRRGH